MRKNSWMVVDIRTLEVVEVALAQNIESQGLNEVAESDCVLS